MNARAGLGAILVVIGIVIAGSAFLEIGGGEGATAASASPTLAGHSATPATAASPTQPTAASPTPTRAPTSSPSPTPEPTTDLVAEASAFYDALRLAIRTAEVEALLALVHPATVERYGEAACRAYFAGLADPTFDVVVHGVTAPLAWDYVTDERKTTIADAWTVDADLTANGTTTRRELHLAPDPADGDLRWFTDCGPPLG
jgi:hypothetical protein